MSDQSKWDRAERRFHQRRLWLEARASEFSFPIVLASRNRTDGDWNQQPARSFCAMGRVLRKGISSSGGPRGCNYRRRVRLEPLRGLREGRRGIDAAYATDSRALWRSKSLSAGREHSWRRGLPRLVERSIPGRSQVGYSRVLRRRKSDPSEEAGIFFRRCAGICEPSGEEVPGPTKAEGGVRIGGTKCSRGGR